MYLFIYRLYMFCDYWSLAFNVYDYGKCRSDWKPCVQKLKKKFYLTKTVTGPWRAGLYMRWNLIFKTQESQTSTRVTKVWESLLKPLLVLFLCLHTSLNSLLITSCVGLNAGGILRGDFYGGLLWCGQQILLCQCVITHKSRGFHCDWWDCQLFRISWN